MSKRGLNIYKRKDGRYEGRYADGYGENGKKKYRAIYGKTYTEGKDKLRQIKAALTAVRKTALATAAAKKPTTMSSTQK